MLSWIVSLRKQRRVKSSSENDLSVDLTFSPRPATSTSRQLARASLEAASAGHRSRTP